MTDKTNIFSLEEAILSTLRYYSLFSYPLLANEIHRFLNITASLKDVEAKLSLMLLNKEVYISSAGFYTMDAQPQWTNRRLEGNRLAEKLLEKSNRYIRKIIQFPFVKSVAISGSLSKYYTDEDGDIDYFIITDKNRLWIARTLLHLFKKTSFLRKNEHYYCMNYFVDETALEIDQKNVYSAIETVTLIPVFNQALISKLKQTNKDWVLKYLPNEEFNEDLRYLLKPRRFLWKGIAEKCIEWFGADQLNLKFMKLTDRKWRKKWESKSYPMDKYDQAFFTSPHVSKNHPANYQSQILTALKSDAKTDLKKEFEECEL